jgi:TolA-binding protein
MKLIYTSFVLFGSLAVALAQPDKSLEKAIEHFQTDPAGAAESVRKLIDKEGEAARIEAWDLLVDMHEQLYLQAFTPAQQQFQFYSAEYLRVKDSILQIDESLRSVEDNQKLMAIDHDLSLLESTLGMDAEAKYTSFIAVCRESTMRSSSARGDLNLRTNFIPVNPDTFTVADSEKQMYEDANALISEGKFSSAEVLLKELKGKYPDSYSVNSSYYFWFAGQNMADSAKAAINRLIALFPESLAAREELAKILFTAGDVYGSKKQVLELIRLYPSQDIKGYYREILAIENKQLNEYRPYRNFEVNRIGSIHAEFGEDMAQWKPYRDAKLKISESCNDSGVVTLANGKFDYLELFSWRALLDYHRESKPEFLRFAYAMEDAGYLDCYVMWANFHFDFREQYGHWVKQGDNKKRILEMIDNHLIGYALPSDE